MEVLANSKGNILKSFLSWTPLALVCALSYGVIISRLVMLLFENYMDQEMARMYAWPLGVFLLLISIYYYLQYLTNSLSAYVLKIEGDTILVKGTSGWSPINREIHLSNIEKVCLGNVPNKMETISQVAHGVVKDQVSARLTFFPSDKKPFKLDFASKAFDNESLFSFLVLLKQKGVDVNVGL